jgi:hypothetical protein
VEWIVVDLREERSLYEATIDSAGPLPAGVKLHTSVDLHSWELLDSPSWVDSEGSHWQGNSIVARYVMITFPQVHDVIEIHDLTFVWQ